MNDVWLLGAMAAVAAHPDALIENLFGSAPDDFKRYGVYTCRLYKNGVWEEIVADTRVPTAEMSAPVAGLKPLAQASFCPIYGRCDNVNEQWVSLLEKAFAKYHGNYECLNHGDVAEGLVELTGGSCEAIALNSKPVQEMVKSGKLWDMLTLHLEDQHMVTCVVETGDEDDYSVDDSTGLLNNHAYSVLMVKHVLGFEFVRVRSPWGGGVWTGEWSDDSPKWEDFPEVLENLKDDASVNWERRSYDGTFWMKFTDFCNIFTKVHVCRVFPDDEYRQYCIQSSWSGKSAGGGLIPAAAAGDSATGGRGGGGDSRAAEEGGAASEYPKLVAKHARADAVKADGNDTWFNNPQYQVTAAEPCNIHISLMQEDRRTDTRLKDNFQIGFEVVQMKDPEHKRAWGPNDDVVFDTASNPLNGDLLQREVCGSNIHLEPGTTYNIVPHAAQQGKESPYILRIFSPVDLEIKEVPQSHSVTLPGAWQRVTERDSAGGPLLVPGSGGKSCASNPKWCENPQFVLRMPKQVPTSSSVDVVVILRRTNMDDGKSSSKSRRTSSASSSGGSSSSSSSSSSLKIGLVACKIPAPEDERARRRVPGERRINALGEEMPTKESSLKNPRSHFLQQNQDASEVEMPDRKMVIDAKEWYQTTDYKRSDVAMLMLPNVSVNSAPHGLLLIPTLSEIGAKGQFVLEVHSDYPVVVESLPDTKSRTLAGEWTESNSGGSHMHQCWKKNPLYHLRLLGNKRSKVKISLSRPAGNASWKAQTGKDSVGSMIGFYLVQGPAPARDAAEVYHDGKPWSETPFVPMNSVSTPSNFVLEPLEDEVYSIIPATFEAGKKGPFFLSVVADCDFSLQLQKDSSRTRRKSQW